MKVTEVIKWMDDINTCDHCGREDLKGTFKCNMSDGTSRNLGSGCMVKLMHGRVSKQTENAVVKEIKAKLNDDTRAKVAAAEAALEKHPKMQKAKMLLAQLDREFPNPGRERLARLKELGISNLQMQAKEETIAEFGLTSWLPKIAK